MAEILGVEDLTAGYRAATVLRGLSFTMEAGESLALLGRNGVGKTTLIDTIMGLTRRTAGAIRYKGRDITALAAQERAAAGIGWTPQERNIFRSLTVEENLLAVARGVGWNLERVYALFPRLKERRRNLGNQLSGGEQQMLAVTRALMLNPGLLLLDEPLEGLAPIIVDELLAAIRRLIVEERLSVILVEQKAAKILPFMDRAIILERGAIVYRGAAKALLADERSMSAFLGVAARGPAFTPET